MKNLSPECLFKLQQQSVRLCTRVDLRDMHPLAIVHIDPIPTALLNIEPLDHNVLYIAHTMKSSGQKTSVSVRLCMYYSAVAHEQ
jgi:hypothetical protein